MHIARSMLIFACYQVAAFLVGVMRGKFGEEESHPQPQASGGGNGASPREEHRNLHSPRVQVARRSVDQTYRMQATTHA
eukprot:COSAG02_NODE_1981_length_10196_cov_11.415668_2_plen_79_part_00